MNKSILFCMCMAVCSGWGAVPWVSGVSMSRYGNCRITYTLNEAPGIVTFDILTNGVSIGAQNLTNAVGDVNKVVQPGSRLIQWNASEIWSGHKFTTPCVSAKVTVWPTNAPPDYLAVDLTKDDCPVTYYASEAALPWGKIWTNQKYKGDVLLMKRIHASHVLSFMGSPETEANRIAGRETRRMCTLTNDFYIGIYPMTSRQYFLIQYGPGHTRDDHKETSLVPISQLSYNQLRYAANNYDNLALPINFPATGRTTVGGSSLLKGWRDKTGLVLDLPTSAQWEFACRAGADTPLYWWNGAEAQLANICKSGTTHNYEVGCYAGNNWMLFDLIGNTYEWCLDYFEDNITADAVTDPLGPTSNASLQRKIRGHHDQDIHKRAAFFSSSSHTNAGQSNIGLRLCITLF